MEKEIMVKICSKCGIVNTERADECESCGAELGASVKNSEAEKLINQITKRNEAMKEAITAEKYGGTKPMVPQIPLTPSRIIIGSVACLVAAAVVVLMVLNGVYANEYSWDLTIADMCALVLLAIAILDSFLPGQMWVIAHCMDTLYYKEMPEPSETGLVFQQIGNVLLILLSSAIFTLHLLAFCGIL